MRQFAINCIAIVLFCGCEKKPTDASALSNDVYLKGKGCYVLSNEAGFLAIEVMRGTYPNVSIKPYHSTNGVDWLEQGSDWMLFKYGTNIHFGGEEVTMSWEADGQTRVSGFLLQKTGIATSTNTAISQLRVGDLHFITPKSGALESTVEKALK